MPLLDNRSWTGSGGVIKKERQERKKRKREMSESRGCSSSAGNELMKREKGGNSLEAVGVGGQEGWGRQME